jgi:fimbrial chaperone protein
MNQVLTYWKRTYFWGALLGGFFVGSAAQAMSVNPLVLELQASGKSMHSSLSVKNDGATPLPVEFKISRLEIDENGKAQVTLVTSDFIVFPPQASIPPGGTQTFRVQWAGNPQIARSQSYIFSVNQLPVKFPKAQSGMQLVFNFGVVVNVAPPDAMSVLELSNVTIGKDEKGIARPQVTIENKGNRHASLGDASLTLTSGQWTQTLTGPALRQMLGVALVQPGKRRRFILPVEVPAHVKAIQGRIDHQQVAKQAGSR